MIQGVWALSFCVIAAELGWGSYACAGLHMWLVTLLPLSRMREGEKATLLVSV